MDKYQLDDVREIVQDTGKYLWDVKETLDDVDKLLFEAMKKLEELRKIIPDFESDFWEVYDLVDKAYDKLEDI